MAWQLCIYCVYSVLFTRQMTKMLLCDRDNIVAVSQRGGHICISTYVYNPPSNLYLHLLPSLQHITTLHLLSFQTCHPSPTSNLCLPSPTSNLSHPYLQHVYLQPMSPIPYLQPMSHIPYLQPVSHPYFQPMSPTSTYNLSPISYLQPMSHIPYL